MEEKIKEQSKKSLRSSNGYHVKIQLFSREWQKILFTVQERITTKHELDELGFFYWRWMFPL